MLRVSTRISLPAPTEAEKQHIRLSTGYQYVIHSPLNQTISALLIHEHRIRCALFQSIINITPLHLSLSLSLLNPLRAVLEAHSLLVVDLAVFSPTSVAVVDFGLPRRRTQHEHLFNILKCLSGGLGEEEECVKSHGGTEDAEDDVDAPLDVDECRWDEVGEGEVEDPVSEVSITPHEKFGERGLTSWRM
jgi:hypothetical protein